MSDIKKESPLIGRAEAVSGGNTMVDAGVALFERPFLGHIALRGRPDDDAFATACSDVLGVDLPMKPNTVAEGVEIAVCWLRPSEWLVLCPADAQQGWLNSLRSELRAIHSAVTDLSGGQTLIAIAGKHATDVLAKGTTLDIHPRVFGAGQCARTLLGKTTAFIRVIEPCQSFEIVVRRSFADYMWHWLRDAAEEYGCQVLAPQTSLQITQAPRPNQAPALAAVN